MIKSTNANAATNPILSNIITLKSVYPKVSDMVIYTNPVKDPKTGQYPSCIRKVNSSGDMIMSDKDRDLMAEGKIVLFPETQIFQLKHGITFDLNDIYQAAMWEAVKNNPIIAKDRNEKDANGNFIIDGPISRDSKNPGRNGMAELYVDRPELGLTRKVSRKKLIHDAESYIFNDERGADGLYTKAKLLGKNMQYQSLADVQDYLLRVASDDPKKIIDLYTGGDTNLRLLLIDAKEKEVIVFLNKLYIYGDNIVLGATDDAVIAWMKDQKNFKILNLIKQDTYPEYYSNLDTKTTENKVSRAKKTE